MRENIMRNFAIAGLLGLPLIAMAAPAQAAWHSYVSHELGFSFEAPGEVKAEVGNSRAEIAGPRQTIVFRSVDDNIEYKVTIWNFGQAQMDGADLLGERVYAYERYEERRVGTYGSGERGKDAIYGRKITVDQPNNGRRTTAAFYSTK